ncbi:MAG TPA: hypothetical protein VJ951_03040 [Bacteroidales bacterium]|nr:hypothetical protein [Bacteroidales bacterium]
MQATDLKEIINQVFDIEKKIANADIEKTVSRSINRIKREFQGLGLEYHNPVGEVFDDTRLDCDAMINTNDLEHMVISEVIKPIIYHKENGRMLLIQRAIVVIE